MAHQTVPGEKEQAPGQCSAPMWIGPAVFLALVAVGAVAYMIVRFL